MASWLSFWNRRRRVANQDRAGQPLSEAWVPWSNGRLQPGDTVFAVGIEEGRLKLITRMAVDTARLSDPATEEITITSADSAVVSFERFVPPAMVERLRFRRTDGTEARFERDASGRLSGTHFQGRASFPELLPASAQLLTSLSRDRQATQSQPARGAKSGPSAGNAQAGARQTRRRVTDVPIEEGDAEGYDVAPGGRTRAVRKESRLQHEFATYLRNLGDEVTRKRIHPPGVPHPLYNDLFNKTRSQLIEAKANGTRDSVRMAVGQLADYSRFVTGAEKAVLLDDKPILDLLDLLVSQGVAAIWRTGNGFADNAGGRFT